MTLGQFLLYATELGAAAALLAMLAWVAVARGRAHRASERLRQEGGDGPSRLPHWCVALGTAAGCA